MKQADQFPINGYNQYRITGCSFFISQFLVVGAYSTEFPLRGFTMS